MDGVSLISLRPAHDDRGDLIAIENKRDVPFDIARVYYLYNVPVNSSRGGHAHKTLRQVIFAMSGSFRLTVKNSEATEQIILRDPGVGVLVENLIWREIDLFSQGSVCMVLASNIYDESDYIRDFDVYRAMVGGAP